MISSLISITLSIIAAFLYDAIKKAYLDQKSASQPEYRRYSLKYIRSVKQEFYIGFFLGIALISIPNTKYFFIDLSIDIFAYFSFFVALMGFMCLVDVVKSMSDKISNNGTNHNIDK